MKRSVLLCIATLALAAIGFGCTTTTETVTDILPGFYHGSITAFDERGDTTTAEGITVSIDKLHTSAITDANGVFTLPIQSGTFTIRVSKNGYGSVRTPYLSFLGGGTKYAIEPIASLYKCPATMVTNIADINASPDNNIVIAYKLNNIILPKFYNIKLRLFDQRPTNSSTKPLYEVIQQPYYYAEYIDSIITCYSDNLTLSTPLPFSHGSKLIAQAAVLNNQGYIDPSTDSVINNAEGKWSEYFPVIIP